MGKLDRQEMQVYLTVCRPALFRLSMSSSLKKECGQGGNDGYLWCTSTSCNLVSSTSTALNCSRPGDNLIKSNGYFLEQIPLGV